MEDFSKLMKLWQKNDEINFQIGLNHLENEIKSCDSYLKIDFNKILKKNHILYDVKSILPKNISTLRL